MASERPIASFPYEDVKDGLGLQTLYGYAARKTDGSYDYFLSPSIVYSSDTDLDSLTINSNTTLTFYSGTFNRPRTMNGTLAVNFCTGINAGGGSTTNTVKLYHYDGSTSTQLGSTWTGHTYSGSTIKIDTATFAVSSQRFKKGDSIKIEVALVHTTAIQRWIGVDPMNRDGIFIVPSTTPGATTQFMVYAPFKIDY